MIQLFERIFYTDGSCWPNPGPGGWAVVEQADTKLMLLSTGYEPMTTNIRMEGEAIYSAMLQARKNRVLIRTDSLHWVNIITDYAKGWEYKGWVKRGKNKNIANLDQVKKLWRLYQTTNVAFEHIRGHRGIPGNELADQAAGEQRQKAAAYRAGRLRCT